jgi:hypothetical protein
MLIFLEEEGRPGGMEYGFGKLFLTGLYFYL